MKLATAKQEAKRIIDASNMLHVPLMSFDGIVGLSPIMQAARSLGLAAASEKFGSRLFANNATPSGILTMPANMKVRPEDKPKMRADWEAQQLGGNQTLGYLDFVGMYSKLDPAWVQSSSWVFSSTTRGLLLGILDSFGRPLFVPSVNTDSLDTILSRPVVISQSHPNVAAGVVGAVQFGSLTDAYILRTAGDLSILRLNERYADTGQVAFIGYHRNSGFSIAVPISPAPLLNLIQHA